MYILLFSHTYLFQYAFILNKLCFPESKTHFLCSAKLCGLRVHYTLTLLRYWFPEIFNYPKMALFLRPKLNPKSEKRLENHIRIGKQTKSLKAQDRRITYEEPKGHRFWTRSLFINILLYIAVVKYIRVNFQIIRTQRSRICDLIKSTPPTLTCSLQCVLN